MHICISNPTISNSYNGLLPGWHQTIILTNAIILFIGPLGMNFSEFLTKIQTFSFMTMHLKVSSGKWLPFCLGLNVLNSVGQQYAAVLYMFDFWWQLLLLSMTKMDIYGKCTLVITSPADRSSTGQNSFTNHINQWPTKYHPQPLIREAVVNMLTLRWLHLLDDIFKWIFLNKNYEFHLRVPINNIPTLIQIMYVEYGKVVMVRPPLGATVLRMTLEIQVSTNVVMPHPDDALLRHNDCLLWRHLRCVPEVGNVACETT